MEITVKLYSYWERKLRTALFKKWMKKLSSFVLVFFIYYLIIRYKFKLASARKDIPLKFSLKLTWGIYVHKT